MRRKRPQLLAQAGAQIGALVAGARAVTNDAAAAFVEDCQGLRPSAFHVARWLHSFGPARPTEIALAVAMDKAAVSRLITDLVDAGFVEKTARVDDARSLVVALTRSGARRLARAMESKTAELGRRLETFDDDELATLAALLSRLNSA